ncbi:MAG: bifunctional metallophosphatase/5'-nucleotidase [Planctomycetaceae bacterium]
MGSPLTMPRRDFLAGAAVAAGGLALPALGAGRDRADLGRARTVSIFHTTDLHGRILPTSTYEGLDDVGGLARCATCIRQWRKESPHSLTVDVGDLWQGTAASLHRDGRVMVELLNRLGYDAWTLGNHDLDWGPEVIDANLALSAPPVLTANIARGRERSGGFSGGWGKVRPWMVKEVGGFRIGLVGLITPGLPYWLAPETLAGTEATDPLEGLTRSLAEIEAEKCDAVVVLGHMGWRFEDDYANPVRELTRAADKRVDIYLAGHSHQNQPLWTLHDVVCTQASYHGIHCGRVDLTFDLESRKLVDRKAFTVLMDDRFALDPLVMELAKADLDAADAQLAREVCTVKAPIAGVGRGSPLVRLFCECFAAALARQGTKVDGVFHGTFETGDLKPGKLTVADCWTLIPYENLLCTAEVTVADLVRILDEDAGVKKSDRTLWPLEVVRAKDGRPERILRDGREIDRDRRLTIAFNSYDAQSGGRRHLRMRDILAAPGANRRTTRIDTRTALVDGLLDRGEIG